ncbi:GNAT family N-acetyltransferase [Achromobacter sp. UMC71]|uniref:GNAT family N-acetyltransferase n=1 Tax=Achromobacter sp. UMC71 TaxID=1862320 RepID=UPI0016033FBA|nr:GNAT family N-acetyltransferase [Achromobacter sp. UMC71]MBB1627626.1 acetyltransferase [Achromobacter sp. UMC71]
MSVATLEYTRPSATQARDLLPGLAALLHACVQDGASVSFVLPYSLDDAQAFWRDKVLPSLTAGKASLLVAIQDGQVAGSVQLDCDTPPNQPHRAEIRKLLVHPDFRRRGIARRLMQDAERLAVECGRSLLTLDTRTGDSAEPLYGSLGYVTVGVIPGFSRDARNPSKVDGTTIMYKNV